MPPLQGIPLVAQSPVRHEPPMGMPLDINTYYPPWKSLTDFAMNADLERLDSQAPPLQMLMHQVSSKPRNQRQ